MKHLMPVMIALAIHVPCRELPAGPPGPAKLVASPEPGWPQWRGPRRDEISQETDLLASWPDGGPKMLWRVSGLGRGYSSPIIAGGRLFITGDIEKELRIFALDLDGKVLWTAANGRYWKGPYPGARASCAYDEGRIYNMNAHGRAACLDARTGRELWAVNVLERFEGTTPTWGLGECLLVDGPRVIVTPGGKKGAMAALDKRTGETVWVTEPVDEAGYASPILLERGGRRLIIGCTKSHAIGVGAETGRLLWKYPLRTRFHVIAMTPVLCGDAVFVTAPDCEGGGRLLRLPAQGSATPPAKVWSTTMDTCHGGVIHAGGLLFGSWYRDYNGWGCIDARTGATLYRTKELSMGSAIQAEGRLYYLSQDGVMALVEADRKGFRIVSRFRLVKPRRRDAWAHPVILDSRIYLRYHDELQCRGVRRITRGPSESGRR